MANRRKIGSPDHYPSGATAGTFGSPTQSAVVTVDEEGHITSSSQTPIAGTAPGGTAGGDLTGTYPNPQLGTVQGTVTAGGALANQVRLAGATAGNPGTVSAIGSDSNINLNLVPKGTGGVQINGGSAVKALRAISNAITPVSVAPLTTAEQTFTYTGLTAADFLLMRAPAPTAGTGIVGWRVSAPDTLAISWVNATAGALTPTAGTYAVLAVGL